MTTPPTPPAQPAPGQPSANPSPLASWGTRALGFIIDILPILILNLIFYWNAGLRTLANLIGIGYTAYMGYLDGVTGQTPGKAMMGTRVVNQQGELLQAGLGVGRKFVHILDSIVCLLGWFLPIVDSKRQTIADKVLQTYVVSGVEKKPFAVELWMPPKT